jgi:hypothetical protein
MSRPTLGFYTCMALVALVAAIFTLASAWLAEHISEGFWPVAIIGVLNAAAALWILAWQGLKDGWSWWRTRPPEVVSTRPFLFRLVEPSIVIALGGLAVSLNFLTGFGWIAVILGFCWLAIAIERHQKLKKILRAQIESAGEFE